jgi:hypothetical protein
MARGKHLFPFRTEQLSPSAPMVLGPQGPGRVGRRRFLLQKEPPAPGGSSAFSRRRVSRLAADVAPLPRCAARRHAVGLASTWGLPGSTCGRPRVGVPRADEPRAVPRADRALPSPGLHGTERWDCIRDHGWTRSGAHGDGPVSAPPQPAHPRGRRQRRRSCSRRPLPSGRRAGGTGGGAGRGGAA